MPFEILNRALVFLRRSLAVEGAEILSFVRSRIFLAGIQPILSGFQFPNHNDSLGHDAQLRSNRKMKIASSNTTDVTTSVATPPIAL